MNRLFLETSSSQASVALFSESKLLAEDAFPSGRSPKSPLFATLERLLKMVETLDEIIVGVGPGSYSGIRIGISAAIGLKLARQIPAHGAFSALGYAGDDFQVIHNARGSWVYSLVRDHALQAGPTHCTRDELDEKIDRSLPIYSPDSVPGLVVEPTFPHATILGRRCFAGQLAAHLPLLPLYLKAPHITVAKN